MDRFTETDHVVLWTRAVNWIDDKVLRNDSSIIEMKIEKPEMFITSRIKVDNNSVTIESALTRHPIIDPKSDKTADRQFTNFANGTLDEISTFRCISGSKDILLTDRFRILFGSFFDKWTKTANIIFPEGDSYTVDIRMAESSVRI